MSKSQTIARFHTMFHNIPWSDEYMELERLQKEKRTGRSIGKMNRGNHGFLHDKSFVHLEDAMKYVEKRVEELGAQSGRICWSEGRRSSQQEVHERTFSRATKSWFERNETWVKNALVLVTKGKV